MSKKKEITPHLDNMMEKLSRAASGGSVSTVSGTPENIPRSQSGITSESGLLVDSLTSIPTPVGDTSQTSLQSGSLTASPVMLQSNPLDSTESGVRKAAEEKTGASNPTPMSSKAPEKRRKRAVSAIQDEPMSITRDTVGGTLPGTTGTTSRILSRDRSRSAIETSSETHLNDNIESTIKKMPRSTILRHMSEILENEIRVEPREWTGPGRKDMNDLVRITGKLPRDLVEEIKQTGELQTHVLEKALRLYLMVLTGKK